ncbi:MULTISPECIES: efflux RND transporter periplasmic adaptor subunit [Acidobacteriaceae]|uniref:efflux RND transporter periplasmic adaptor subunit n=1 Tax=Acidobacteriaceae TaxID=204434 RepID=UPI00131E2B03|nr:MULTISPECIES: efflux RND transporter periplasmic adaptor subunit [Acidobacteriaceae]MDW5265852.1 efflux RND transporter periplasmic adaptor subunit [Edaphobacter sp.]
MSSQTNAEMNTDTTTPSHLPNSAPERRGFSAGVWIALAVVAIVLLVVIIFGILSRSADEHTLEKHTEAAAILSVNVIHPSAAPLTPEISLPGNTQAYIDTPIYARTSGYLQHWYFDIGARVRKGQLMATIETPELDQQLQVAEADLKSTEANLDLANTTAARYINLLKTNSVSKQETDQATGDAAAKKAAVDAAMANVRRLQQLQSFEKIYAPFDGIVTVRNVDVGALIDAGSNTTPKELFHLASIEKIRVFVPVPEAYAGDIKNGSTATLTLDQFPGQIFKGTIARNSNMIDAASRTLNVEVDVDNPKGQLLPGAYVFVHFKVPERIANLTIPSNTLLFRSEGLRVGVVRDDKVILVPITITHDAGQVVEVAAADLKTSDEVILDPSDSLIEGQQVHVAQVSQQKQAGE